MLKWFFDEIREELGQPVKLRKLLATKSNVRVNLGAPSPCIRASSVIAWHRLGEADVSHWPMLRRGTLRGWKHVGGQYYGYEIHRPEYEQIGVKEVVKGWRCDISDVHGFSASKSDLSMFTSTDEMVERNSRDMISDITIEKLNENLAHQEIRILHSEGTTDYFECYQWDRRVWLMNSGGSHHFAAAKYIAVRLNRRVPLQGSLNWYSIDGEKIASLRRDFEMFVIPDDAEFSNAFLDVMRGFRATWLWHEMPRPFNATRAILLPRTESRSMRVADEFRRAGVIDLGEFLSNLAASQGTSIGLNGDAPTIAQDAMRAE
ncbi:DUF6685 family protein [Burkholderia sp. AU15512]|uniref:DUF6685 family protein n=1 Tax=Burkholderia sp. AU15512 TaxID=2015345 RepID=UPI00117BEBFE|nr:DUF6685 family protein [Burkholderia sp. AU15512]